MARGAGIGEHPAMVNTVWRLGLCSLLSLLACVALGAGPASAAPRPGTYVAALDDRPRLHLAIVTDGRRAVGYVCDDGKRSVWFDGRFRGRSATLRARRRAATIRVVQRGRALSGVVRFAGRTLRFRARRASGRAGLWRASVNGPDGNPVEATWIRLANGRLTGTQVTGTQVTQPPDLDVANPDVQLANRDLTAVQFDPPDLFPFDVAPQTVVIDTSAPQRTGGTTITVIMDGIADVSGVVVRIDGQAAQQRPRQPGSDRLGVHLPGAIASGPHDVAVRLPGQAERVRRDAFTVVLTR